MDCLRLATASFPVFFAACCVPACAQRASTEPLSAERAGDAYYYGQPSYGGKTAPARDAPTPPPSQEPAKVDEPPKSPSAPEPAEPAEPSGDGSQAEASAKPGIPPAEAAKAFLGTYVGEDRVSIEFDGLPEQVQDDDQAKIRVDVEDARVSVTVVDTNSGGDLCTVSGEPQGRKIVFKPGQECFQEMLGGPITAVLLSGTAGVTEQRLTVELEISLELRGPENTLGGMLRYSFAGDRE